MGSTVPAVAASHNAAWGAVGARWSLRPASARRRSSFRALHARHEATTFSQLWVPPRERGTTWSRSAAARLQYWQRCPSRANTARRESGTRVRYGTRTKWTRRITEGAGTTVRSERNSAPLRSTISAFSFSTSTTARRADTTQRGSKLALSSNALPNCIPPESSGSLPVAPAAPRGTAGLLGPAPLEVRDEVAGCGRALAAVLRLEAQLEVCAVRQRKERWMPPPRGPRHPPRLTQCGR